MKKKQQKATKITNKEISSLTGYSTNYLKKIGKDKATFLLKKATSDDILKDRLKTNILEGLTFFSENLKEVDFSKVEDSFKLQGALKFFEIILKEFNNKK